MSTDTRYIFHMKHIIPKREISIPSRLVEVCLILDDKLNQAMPNGTSLYFEATVPSNVGIWEHAAKGELGKNSSFSFSF